MKNVLVIGASGFAGRHLVRELSEQGYEIYLVRNKNALHFREDLHVISGGIKSVNRRLLKSLRPEIIYHFARPRLPYFKRTGRLLAGYYAGWMNRRLLREIRRSGSPVRLVFASGSLMYGPSPHPHDEDAPLKPFSFAKQYYRGELPIVKALKDGHFPVMILRFPWLLGNGSWFEWFYLRPMKRSGAVPLFGQGMNFMEVIDVKDAIKIAVHIASNAKEAGVYNLVSRQPVTQLEFASAVAEVSGLPLKDYRQALKNIPEKEAIQSFTSNIVLSTRHKDLQGTLRYTPLYQTLVRIVSEAGIRPPGA